MADKPDPLFKSKMIQAYEDCYAFSAAMPDSILERDAKTKFFGRQKVFFKCTHVRVKVYFYFDTINDDISNCKFCARYHLRRQCKHSR